MTTASLTANEPAAAVKVGLPSRSREHLFYSGMAIAMTLTAFAGFARSYYLKAHFQAPPELTPLLHLHGLAMSTWMALLIVQTSLIAANRAHIHRRLGIAGAVFAVLLMLLAGTVAVTRAKQGLLGPTGGPPPLTFLAIPMMTLVVFPALFGAAIYFRHRSDIHKRLVLLATIEFITAAVARIPGISTLGPPAFFAVTDMFVVAIVINDLLTLKRVHPATLWGGLFLIASQPLRLIISGTATWMTFAKWVTS